MSKQIDDLAKRLQEASDAYYNDTPLISDTEFDTLRDELERLDPSHPFLVSIGAPVQVTAWPIVKHSRIIGSLSKVKHNEKDEFLKWAKDKGDLMLTEKLDGITIVATYDKGVLVNATTRGNGEEGECITPNFLKMKNTSAKLDDRFTGELRGEIILEKSVFTQYFQGYKNCRNAAAGKARDTKDKDDLVKHLKVIYFQAVTNGLQTKLDEFKLIKKLGLQHVNYGRFFSWMQRTPEDLWNRFLEYKRDELDYLIDGLVVDANELKLHAELGMVSGRPKASIAIKFESEGAVSTVNGITWQIGLTGRVCPVAEIEPVDVAGVTVSRVTLNNLDYIKQLDVAIGDKILVIRSNDVIPFAKQVVDRSGRKYICEKCKN